MVPALRENYVLISACSALRMLLLLSWWLDCLGHRIVVTDRRTIFRKGLLSKFTNEVLHSHVKNLARAKLGDCPVWERAVLAPEPLDGGSVRSELARVGSCRHGPRRPEHRRRARMPSSPHSQYAR